MGYCKDCMNGEAYKNGIYCHIYRKVYDEYEGCTKHFTPRYSRSSSSCYITSACVEAMNKPDDCYELNTLRNFRDTYIMQLSHGDEIIEEYYNKAPKILKHIHQEPNSSLLLSGIYKDLILPAVQLIENEELDKAFDLYVRYVKMLYQEYCV